MNIVMAAYGFPRGALNKFMKWNEDAFSKNNVTVWVGYHEEFEDPEFPNMKVLKYPHEEPIFSIGRTVNYVMRRVDCSDNEIIIKTDPDIVFSDLVLKHIADRVKMNKGMVCICANIDEMHLATAPKWSSMTKRMTGKGACFVMTKADWFSMHGYDERIEGWGGDDDEMFYRASQRISMSEDASSPLFHVNHPQRKNVQANFPRRSPINRTMIKSNNWSSERWRQPDDTK